MPDVFQLPPYFTARSIDDVAVFCRAVLESDDWELIDASALKFIDPFGLSILGAVFQTREEYGGRAKIQGVRQDVASYMSRMDAFRGVELLDPLPETRGRRDRGDSLVELTCVRKGADVAATAQALTRTLVGGMSGLDSMPSEDGMSASPAEKVAYLLNYVFTEVLDNSVTHGRRCGFEGAAAWVTSQYYASNGILKLGFADTGCGFLNSLRSHPALDTQSHHAAIMTALQPNISCNRDLRAGLESVNQGIGLTMAARIAQAGGGRMVLLSGDALHSTVGRSGNLLRDGFWQGVAMSLELPRNKLPGIKIPELLPSTNGQSTVILRFE